MVAMIHESQPPFWFWTGAPGSAGATPKIAAMAERAKLVARLVFVCDPLR
jgi:hypothetical protein